MNAAVDLIVSATEFLAALELTPSFTPEDVDKIGSLEVREQCAILRGKLGRWVVLRDILCTQIAKRGGLYQIYTDP